MTSNQSETTQTKREGYIDWEEYYMGTALLAAKRSKDPRRQVGACIVNTDKIIVGIGYNGMPNGCPDDEFPWVKESTSHLGNKHFYVCHAEMNAIRNKNTADVKDATIYVTLFPCNECAKMIIQWGIKTIVYLADDNTDKEKNKAAKKMLERADVVWRRYEPKRPEIKIEFTNPIAQ